MKKTRKNRPVSSYVKGVKERPSMDGNRNMMPMHNNSTAFKYGIGSVQSDNIMSGVESISNIHS